MENERNLPGDMVTDSSSRLAPIFGTALATLMVLAIGAYALRSMSMSRDIGECYEQETSQNDQEPDYRQWQKPLVALVLSGQMHGFVDPCGCSFPQYGGLTRRFNFIQSLTTGAGTLKNEKWDVVGIDLGELPGLKGIHKQNLLKYELSIRALGAMNYRAIGIGRDEILSPLGEALAQIENDKKPFPRPINLSLAHTAPKEKYHDLNVRSFEIIADTTPKIGVISMMGPDLRDELKPLEKFVSTDKGLPKALQAFADADVKIGIILHHEYPVVDKKLAPGIETELAIEKKRRELAVKAAEYCAEARKKNKKIPEIHLMMVLTEQGEPSAIMRPLGPGSTQLIEIGHKGKYVGVLGVYAAGKSYRLQYQMVRMGPEWETKKGEEKNNAVITLMEKHNQELKREDMLAKAARSPHYNQIMPPNMGGLKATYVGSERCADCHSDAAKVWLKTPHSEATETLEKLKHPSGRQYDPECMMCHTTGFKHPGGYNDLVTNLANWPAKPEQAPNAKKIKAHNDNLRGVSCESCHGPGSLHVKNPMDATLYALINPYRVEKEERDLEDKEKQKVITPVEQKRLSELFNKRTIDMGRNLCTKCHDGENDVNWGQPGKDTPDKWKKLIHRTPKNNNGAVIPLPEKGNNPPVIQNAPPGEIEIIQDKK
jgi:hypothetical protein